MNELLIDTQRAIDYADQTGIYVRAKRVDGSFCSTDIATLTRDSLIEWLNDDAHQNRAEELVLILLGYSTEGG